MLTPNLNFYDDFQGSKGKCSRYYWNPFMEVYKSMIEIPWFILTDETDYLSDNDINLLMRMYNKQLIEVELLDFIKMQMKKHKRTLMSVYAIHSSCNKAESDLLIKNGVFLSATIELRVRLSEQKHTTWQ